MVPEAAVAYEVDVSRQLLNFRNVPDDEAGEVRDLLDENGVEYYETPPNRWGISMGGIWIRHDGDYPRARALMDEYQAERAERARAAYRARKQRGEVETLATVIRDRPVQVLAYLAVCAGILVLMLLPVWLLLG